MAWSRVWASEELVGRTDTACAAAPARIKEACRCSFGLLVDAIRWRSYRARLASWLLLPLVLQFEVSAAPPSSALPPPQYLGHWPSAQRTVYRTTACMPCFCSYGCLPLSLSPPPRASLSLSLDERDSQPACVSFSAVTGLLAMISSQPCQCCRHQQHSCTRGLLQHCYTSTVHVC